jgi:UDP-N-acetylmuramoylalanine--D-glutamate ligase
MDIENRRFLVVGLARSGLAAANFLARRGGKVVVTDRKPPQQFDQELKAIDPRVQLVLGEHRADDFARCDFVILSPGVPTDLPELARARSKNIPVLGEVELAARFLTGRIVGITGSNGKTTTTTLIGELARRCRLAPVVAGNIGSALIRFVDSQEAQPERLFVVELSSFQLETTEQLRCHVAVFLNLTPDHLDRYAGLQEYGEAKKRIFMNQGPDDYAVLNADDPYCLTLADDLQSQVVFFSRLRPLERGVFAQEGRIWIRLQEEKHCLMPVGDVRLKGAHNLENVLAALAAGSVLGLDRALMADAVRNFSGVEHRLEFTRTLEGVAYFNDSKATNVDSAVKAIEAFSQPLILIMGGRDKGGDFEVLRPLVREKVKTLILIGEATQKISDTLGGETATVTAATLQEGVLMARSQAVPGDVVLLAPACASFDMFTDFEHRGRVFKETVNQL